MDCHKAQKQHIFSIWGHVYIYFTTEKVGQLESHLKDEKAKQLLLGGRGILWRIQEGP